MSIRIESYSRHRQLRGTRIRLSGTLGSIMIQVESKLNPRQRKEIALSFIRQIKPWLKYFSESSVSYPQENWIPNFERTTLDLNRSTAISTPSQKIGFEIRLKRMSLGLSQKELALQIGSSPCRISNIERGKAIPRRRTLIRIYTALQTANLPTNPSGDILVCSAPKPVTV